MNRPFEAVYALLPEYEPSEVEGALAVVPARLGTSSVQDLAAACRDYIEGKIVDVPQVPAEQQTWATWEGGPRFNAAEFEDIFKVMRQLNNERIRKHRQADLWEYERLQFCQRQYMQADVLELVRVAYEPF